MPGRRTDFPTHVGVNRARAVPEMLRFADSHTRGGEPFPPRYGCRSDQPISPHTWGVNRPRRLGRSILRDFPTHVGVNRFRNEIDILRARDFPTHVGVNRR